MHAAIIKFMSRIQNSYSLLEDYKALTFKMIKSLNSLLEKEKGEVVLYQPDDNVRLEVRLQDDTVWLTQQQMAELFNTTRNNITLHIGNIFKEGELEVNSVRKESLLTAADGKKYRTKFYNLDVIISVGYRVKSQVGTRFRQWALAVLKDYLLRGYAALLPRL